VPDPILSHHAIGDDRARSWMLVLHGIYGAGRNWATFARSLNDARPDWGQILVDLRLHGHSRGFEPPHTLTACVHDLVALSGSLDPVPTVVLGHSFGGKLALLSARALRPRQVWVIDSTPSRRSPQGSAYRMLGVLRRLPTVFPDRGAAVAALQGEGFEAQVASWMATNLEIGRDGYRWKFAVDDIEALLDDFFRTDAWDILERPPAGTSVHMIRAADSSVMTEAEAERAATVHVATSVDTLPGGHWLHVDNPSGLLAFLAEKLPSHE